VKRVEWKRRRIKGIVWLLFLSGVYFDRVDRCYSQSTPWGDKSFVTKPADAIKLASSFKPEGDHPIVVLLDDKKYSFDNGGRLRSEWRWIYQVRTAQGLEEWGALETGWEPWHEEKPSIRARVTNPDGSIHWLDKKTIDDAPAEDLDQNIHVDDRLLRAPLPGLTVGSVVEAELITQETQAEFSQGTVRRVYFGVESPAQLVRLVVETSSSAPLRNAVHLLPGAKKTESREKGVSRLVVEAGPCLPQEEFLFGLPNDVPQSPHVAFSTGVSWQEVAAGYQALVQNQLKGTSLGEIARKVTAKTQGDREASIKALTAFVHREVRYTGLEFGQAALRPEKPENTLQRKYGDCKDKGTLLVALMREIGIDARLALLSAESDQDVEEGLPGIGLFNHAIVYLPGTPAFWIDATDEYGPWGDLPEQCEGRRALVIDPKTVGLVKTPESTSADNRVTETRIFEMAEYGPARVTETTVAHGGPARSLRSYYSLSGTDDLRKELEEYVRSTYLAKKLESMEYSKPSDPDGFTLKIVAADASRGTTTENEAAVAITPLVLTGRLPWDLFAEEEEEERESVGGVKKPKLERGEQDYILSMPYVEELNYRIIYPPGFRPSRLPSSRIEDFGPAKLSYQFAEENGAVTARLRFDTVKRRYTPGELKSLKDALSKFSKREPVTILFEHVAYSLLASGKGREAAAEFRKLIELHPKEALHHAQLAKGLLVIGLGEAARKEATRATELEPQSAVAWLSLGWILQYDLIGRHLRKGFDYEAAERALRKGLDLKPDDPDGQLQLAILLEHDKKGIRYYSPDCRVSEAIEIYRKQTDILKGTRFQDNIAFALMWAGKYDELMELLRKSEKSENAQAIELVAIAKAENVGAALQKAYVIPDPAVRSKVSLSAANMLMQVRSYPEAAEFLTAGAQGNPNASQTLQAAEMLRKARRFEEVLKDENSPINVARQAILWLMDADRPAESASQLFSRHSLTELGRTASKNRRILLQMTGSMRLRGVPAKALADVGLASLTFDQEGDGDLFRITVTPPVPFSGLKGHLYVTKEEGGYRVLATPGCLARDIVSRLDRADLQSARKLLDWAADDSDVLEDDPDLGIPEITRFWNSQTDKSKPENMRYAAACLFDKHQAREGQTLMTKALSETEHRLHRENISFALASLSRRAGDFEEMLRLAGQMKTEFGRSDQIRDVQTYALYRLARWTEYEKVIRDALGNRDDPFLTLKLSDVLREQGRFQESRDLLQGLVDKGKAGAVEYNNLAWSSLLLDSVSDADLENARRAVSLTAGPGSSSLHTLACLYAEKDKTTEARDMIWQSLEARAADTPEANDWYVFARIAEAVNLPETAAELYRRVVETSPPSVRSSHALASRRLKNLTAAQKTGSD